jgi:hypothetical protein
MHNLSCALFLCLPVFPSPRDWSLISSLTFLLASMGLAFALSPISVLEVRDAETNIVVLCEPIRYPLFAISHPPAAISHYVSRNSIYGVLVTETWSLEPDRIHVAQVQSAPIVLDYYGIKNYRVHDGLAEGAPVAQAYEQVRLKVSPRGEQRLIVRQPRGREWALSQQFAEGTVLVVKVRRVARIGECF